MKTVISLCAMTLCVCALNVLPALAGDPCAVDVKRFCPRAKTGQDVIRCLAENERSLSPACEEMRRGARDHARGEMRGVMQACRQEINSFCSQLGAENTSATFGCLRQNQNQLSIPCRQALQR